MRSLLARGVFFALVMLGACRQEEPAQAPDETEVVAESALAQPGTHAVSLSAGGDHSCAMVDDRPWCWGLDQPLPVRRSGPSPGPRIEGVVEIDSGGDAMCLVLEKRRLRCFGRAVPVGLEGIVDVDMAPRHACGVLDTGYVRCWGDNGWGQLGAGRRERTRRAGTAALDPGINGAVSVATGPRHSCALDREGRVLCWGNSAPTAKVAGMGPVLVPGLPPAHRIAAGDEGRSCAIGADGRVRCWRLAWTSPNQSVVDALTPPELVPGVRGPVELDMDGRHACVREEDGDVLCWGVNHRGVLGDGTFTDRPRLPRKVNALEPATQIAVGADHVCARTEQGVRCWGDNSGRELGLAGAPAVVPTPVEVEGVREARALALGSRHTCAITEEGPLCWGDNERGQLGRAPGPNEPRWRGRPLPWRRGGDEIDAGAANTCSRSGNKVTCTGSVEALRRGATGSEVEIKLRNVQQVELAFDGSWGCSRHGDGSVRCFGTLPWQSCVPEIDRCTPRVFGPTKVKGLSTAQTISVGRSHACATTEEGRIACWGTNAFGQAGLPEEETPRGTATLVEDANQIVAVGAGWTGSCALDAEGLVQCWGSAASSEDSHTLRTLEELPPVSVLSVGPTHACAVTESAELWCWGTNQFGQLGTGSTSAALRDAPPEQVQLAGVTHVEAGPSHTCATTIEGALHCWGANERGQLGTGVPAASREPVSVVGLGEELEPSEPPEEEESAREDPETPAPEAAP